MNTLQVARSLSLGFAVLVVASSVAANPPSNPLQLKHPAGSAVASPSAPGATNPIPPAPISTVSTPVDPASAGLSKDAVALGELRRETATATEKLKLLLAKGQVVDAEKHLGQNSTVTADIPELIGIEGGAARMRAQFLVGTSILTVAVGQWLTSEWQVKSILSNGVALTKRGGKETHTILFGHAPVSGGEGALSSSMTSQGGGSPGPSMVYPTTRTSPR